MMPFSSYMKKLLSFIGHDPPECEKRYSPNFSRVMLRDNRCRFNHCRLCSTARATVSVLFRLVPYHSYINVTSLSNAVSNISGSQTLKYARHLRLY